MAEAARTHVVFSDIDGTIMHDPEAQRGEPGLLVAPPSTSGRQGAISIKSIEQVAALRQRGLKFVIITGARLSTLLMRLPFLPAADAFVCENGGRVFYPESPVPTACPITEDLEWRALQASMTGPAHQDSVPPAKRDGALWDWYRKLADGGWTLDASGYTTSFRIHARNGKTMEELQAVISTAPQGLSCSFNLGAADFYPATSGKCKAARYLMKHFGSTPEDCAFLCDDDNDMELAGIVGKAFLPSISSESVRQAVAARPDHFVQATLTGTAATEEILEAVGSFYRDAGLRAVP